MGTESQRKATADSHPAAMREVAHPHGPLSFEQERRVWIYIALLVGVLFVGVLWKRVFITIPAGHHGVLFQRLAVGTVTEHVFPEGLYVIAPWNRLTPYETRLLARTVTIKVPSEEGLEMSISVSLRFRPHIESLGYLHQDIGPEYFERLVLPEVQGHLRKILGKRKAQDIYTGAHDVFEEIAHVPVLGRLRRGMGHGEPADPYVLLEELRVLDIVRPALVADAVSEKQRQEQLSLEYKHRLQREQQEAERKRIEAVGVRDYNHIIGSIQPDVLRWRSLDVTNELARSSNAKVVVLGGGQGAPPMMLNVGDGSASPPPPSSDNRPAATPAAKPAETRSAPRGK